MIYQSIRRCSCCSRSFLVYNIQISQASGCCVCGAPVCHRRLVTGGNSRPRNTTSSFDKSTTCLGPPVSWPVNSHRSTAAHIYIIHSTIFSSWGLSSLRLYCTHDVRTLSFLFFLKEGKTSLSQFGVLLFKAPVMNIFFSSSLAALRSYSAHLLSRKKKKM